MAEGNEAHKLRLRRILTAYGEGDMEPLREALDAGVVYQSHSPRELFRWGGRHEGIADGIAALSAIATDYAVHRYDILELVGEGDVVWVTAALEATDRHNKIRVDSRLVSRWQFKGEHIASVDEYFDNGGIALKQGLVVIPPSGR